MNPFAVLAFCVSVFVLFVMLAIAATHGKKVEMRPIELDRDKWVCTSVDVRKLDGNGTKAICLEFRKVKE